MVVLRMDLNLIVIEKTIHKSKYFIFGALINDVINELSRVIIFRERFIQTPKAIKNANSLLFLVNWNYVGHPHI